MFYEKKVLVLAPHTDDAELGAGGLIAKALRNKCEVYVAAFSAAQESLPSGFSDDATEKEFNTSMELLGVTHHKLFNFKVRHFDMYRQEILQAMIELKREFSPDVVVMPSLNDVHQDHQVVANESVRAYKQSSILMYEMPWNNLILKSNLFLHLNENDLQMKLAAINCYKSQLVKGSRYLSDDFIRSFLSLNSARTGREGFAEAFEILRLVE
ncbi:PIG-L deacetylase family protein [Pseudidiomarina donghaiensis]|uniref:GlcNAc-PI de-N-acetylase n=1 Tax=Pseudidiomarina donghaiensis TaxID=519452 RepID=A0A432XKV9_9GAMM|nr:PIG-L deacetylase family protein [Pseudidiomarina donghaiensis]RUO49326.1 GlcNAc-PI de-N-acetylase [Pseudidiomarina donghaiensis]SFV20996.1 N-acetylglucosaminyl deacetylase, LmbE family [Pseudidiomarina donghaiensis]